MRDSAIPTTGHACTFGARYYSPSLGRFLTPDWSATPEPVPFANLENPQSLNLYSYVLNNPVSATDPDGHWCVFGFGTTCTKSAQIKLPVKEGDPVESEFDTFVAEAKSEAAALGKQAWSNFTSASCRAQVCQGSVLPEGELVEEGLAEIAPKLTQFGWQGGAPWRAAVKEIGRGGTIENIAGTVPTEAEARSLIQEAGGRIDRVDPGHAAPNPHTYAHINYTTSTGLKGTVRVGGR